MKICLVGGHRQSIPPDRKDRIPLHIRDMQKKTFHKMQQGYPKTPQNTFGSPAFAT